MTTLMSQSSERKKHLHHHHHHHKTPVARPSLTAMRGCGSVGGDGGGGDSASGGGDSASGGGDGDGRGATGGMVVGPSSTTTGPPTASPPPPPPPSVTAPHHHQRIPRTKRKHTVVFKYCEEMNELNEAANNRPRSALIHSIQQENRHIRQLQQENKELRLALEEHQNVMELIMSKYRQQVAKLVSVNKKQQQPNTHDQAKLQTQIERVSEMVAVMRKAASLGDDECQQQQRLISALATENKGLREMLSIASRSGSLQPPMSAVDVETQTDHNMLNLEENNLEEMQAKEHQDQDNEHQEMQPTDEHQESQSNEHQEKKSNELQEKTSNDHQESTVLKKTQSEPKSTETDTTLPS